MSSLGQEPTLKNQIRRATLGRPAIKLLGWGSVGGGGGASTSLRSTNLALCSALVTQTLICSVCKEDSISDHKLLISRSSFSGSLRYQ